VNTYISESCSSVAREGAGSRECSFSVKHLSHSCFFFLIRFQMWIDEFSSKCISLVWVLVVCWQERQTTVCTQPWFIPGDFELGSDQVITVVVVHSA